MQNSLQMSTFFLKYWNEIAIVITSYAFLKIGKNFIFFSCRVDSLLHSQGSAEGNNVAVKSESSSSRLLIKMSSATQRTSSPAWGRKRTEWEILFSNHEFKKAWCKQLPKREVAGLCLLHLVPICIQSSVLSPRHAWSPPFTWELFHREEEEEEAGRTNEGEEALVSSAVAALNCHPPAFRCICISLSLGGLLCEVVPPPPLLLPSASFLLFPSRFFTYFASPLWFAKVDFYQNSPLMQKNIDNFPC